MNGGIATANVEGLPRGSQRRTTFSTSGNAFSQRAREASAPVVNHLLWDRVKLRCDGRLQLRLGPRRLRLLSGLLGLVSALVGLGLAERGLLGLLNVGAWAS